MNNIAICVDNSGYTYQLTLGKEYEILRQEPGIFPGDTYYVFIDDNGKESASHPYRFNLIQHPKRIA